MPLLMIVIGGGRRLFFAVVGGTWDALFTSLSGSTEDNASKMFGETNDGCVDWLAGGMTIALVLVAPPVFGRAWLRFIRLTSLRASDSFEVSDLDLLYIFDNVCLKLTST